MNSPKIAFQPGKPRPIAPDFLGFNGNLTTLDHPWEDARLRGTFAATQPGHLCYPGGINTNLHTFRLTPWFGAGSSRKIHNKKSYWSI